MNNKSLKKKIRNIGKWIACAKRFGFLATFLIFAEQSSEVE